MHGVLGWRHNKSKSFEPSARLWVTCRPNSKHLIQWDWMKDFPPIPFLCFGVLSGIYFKVSLRSLRNLRSGRQVPWWWPCNCAAAARRHHVPVEVAVCTCCPSLLSLASPLQFSHNYQHNHLSEPLDTSSRWICPKQSQMLSSRKHGCKC